MRLLLVREQIIDSGCVQRYAVDQDVPALAMSSYDRHDLTLRRVQPICDSGLEALIKKCDLEVVTHATVNGDERDRCLA